MQKHLIWYLQPRSFPKTEHQWLELTLRFFFCPWTFRMYCGCLVLLGHLGGVVWKVRGTGHPAVALSCMFVQLLTLQQRLQSSNGDFIKQLRIYSSRWNDKTFQ